jgi:hypothetical protein
MPYPICPAHKGSRIYSPIQTYPSRAITNQEKRPAGATPPTFSCNCRLAGPVPLRFSALRAGVDEDRAAVHLAVRID